MPKRGDKEFLLDIIEAIKRIELYTKGLTYQDFLQRMETQDNDGGKEKRRRQLIPQSKSWFFTLHFTFFTLHFAFLSFILDPLSFYL
jgi:hypothetical protein